MTCLASGLALSQYPVIRYLLMAGVTEADQLQKIAVTLAKSQFDAAARHDQSHRTRKHSNLDPPLPRS